MTEAELDVGFNALEEADRALSTDQGFIGVASGLVVAQAAVPNLTVQVSGPGVVYDQLGQRVAIPSTQTVNCAVDESAINTAVVTPGNSRILSLFIEFDRALSDPRVDGNSLTVYFVRAESFQFNVAAGAEAVSPTAPALRGDQILLADITLIFGQTAILNADISTTRREWAFKTTSGTAVAVGTAEEAIQVLATAIGTGAAGLAAHLADAVDAHDASAISSVPAGNLAATEVQAALNELDSEKAGLALTNTFTAALNHFKSINLGLGLDTSDADRELAREFGVMSGTASKRVLLYQSSASGVGFIRIYAFRGAGSSPAYELTINAFWTHATSLWNSDTTADAYMFALDAQALFSGFHVWKNKAGAAGRTWAHSTAGWSAYSWLSFSSLVDGSTIIFKNGTITMAETTTGTTAGDSNIGSTGVPVANTLYAKSMPKAWGTITTDGVGGIVVDDGFNITSATIVGDDVRITIGTDLADTAYAVVYGGEGYLHHRTLNKAVGSFDVDITSILADADVDPAVSILSFSFVLFGRQA